MRAIIFSDIHFHYWEKYNPNNRRLKAQLSVFEKLCRLADRYNVPLIFGGDLFNDNMELTNKLLNYINANFSFLFKEYDVKLYAISGNHDMSEKNTLTHRSPSYVKALSEVMPSIKVIDFQKAEFEDYDIHGIPYLEDNDGLTETIKDITLNPKKTNILLIHTGFKGQKDTSGVVVSDGYNIKEDLFKRFDLVLSGHIHKPGRVRNNLFSIGAPLQLRASDSGGKFGYWILNNDFTLRFKELKDTPKFRFYSDPSEKDNDNDIWVKRAPKDSGAKVISVESVSIDPIKVARHYCKEHGVVSKKKVKVLTDLIWEANDSI